MVPKTLQFHEKEKTFGETGASLGNNPQSPDIEDQSPDIKDQSPDIELISKCQMSGATFNFFDQLSLEKPHSLCLHQKVKDLAFLLPKTHITQEKAGFPNQKRIHVINLRR